MSVQELELPLHLYTEARGPDGKVTGLNCPADKLVSWADHGCGDAIERLCEQLLDREMEVIDMWKENQFLLLEETWVALENGIDDVENEKQYALACDAVCREADEKAEVAVLQLKQRKSEIEKLVRQSREYLAMNQPAPQGDTMSGYLFILAAVAVLVYLVLFQGNPG